MRVLIVDDDLATRKFMSKYLARYGECLSAESGENAVQIYRNALQASRPFSLICMDILMPGMDGYETLEKIRELEEEFQLPNHDRAKVIMTSGMDVSENATKAFASGCVAYTTKPIDFSRFDNLLHDLNLV